MMLFELAHMGLSLYSSAAALDKTLARWSEEGGRDAPSTQALPRQLGQQMSQALHGRLPASAFTIQVREFGADDARSKASADAPTSRPRSLTVDVYQIYATPLPGLIGLGDAFRYRYKRFMGHPSAGVERKRDEWVPCCLLPQTWGPAAWQPYLLSALWAGGVALLGGVAWYLGVGSVSVAFVFALLVLLAGAQAGAFLVVTTLAGGLLVLLRLPYAWALVLGVLWWVAQ